MYKLDDLFDFDGDGELDSVERMEMYQFMDNTANRNRNRFFEDDEGLNLRMQDWIMMNWNTWIRMKEERCWKIQGWIRMIMISDPSNYKE